MKLSSVDAVWFGLVWFLAALFQVSVLSRVGGGVAGWWWVAEIKNTAKLSLAWAELCNKRKGQNTNDTTKIEKKTKDSQLMATSLCLNRSYLGGHL